MNMNIVYEYCIWHVRRYVIANYGSVWTSYEQIDTTHTNVESELEGKLETLPKGKTDGWGRDFSQQIGGLRRSKASHACGGNNNIVYTYCRRVSASAPYSLISLIDNFCKLLNKFYYYSYTRIQHVHTWWRNETTKTWTRGEVNVMSGYNVQLGVTLIGERCGQEGGEWRAEGGGWSGGGWSGGGWSCAPIQSERDRKCVSSWYCVGGGFWWGWNI